MFSTLQKCFNPSASARNISKISAKQAEGFGFQTFQNCSSVQPETPSVENFGRKGENPRCNRGFLNEIALKTGKTGKIRPPTSCWSAQIPAFAPKPPMKPRIFAAFAPSRPAIRCPFSAPPAPNPGFGATKPGFEKSNAGFGFPKAGFVALLPPPVLAPPSHPPAPHPFAPEKAETRLNTAEGLENQTLQPLLH